MEIANAARDKHRNLQPAGFRMTIMYPASACRGYDWGEDKVHDSLADCKATLFCYHKIREEEGL